MQTFNNVVRNARRASRISRVKEFEARDIAIAGSVNRTAFRHGYKIAETLIEEYAQIVADGDENNQTAVY